MKNGTYTVFGPIGAAKCPVTAAPRSYRFHKARNCAVVTIDGKNRYLGPYGSPESQECYGRLIAQWRAGDSSGASTGSTAPTESNRTLSINELILRFLEHATVYYREHGEPTGELSNFKLALQPVKALYGKTPAVECSPQSLEPVRESMIDRAWCRTHINRQVGRVKRMFHWASTKGLVAPATHHGLLAVETLITSGPAFGEQVIAKSSVLMMTAQPSRQLKRRSREEYKGREGPGTLHTAFLVEGISHDPELGCHVTPLRRPRY